VNITEFAMRQVCVIPQQVFVRQDGLQSQRLLLNKQGMEWRECIWVFGNGR
jgi:hypothetical protein